MADQKNNIVIIFPPEAESAASDILKKYNLQEDTGKTAEKIKNGATFNIVTLHKIIRDFVSGKIPETNFPAVLQKEFSILPQSARDLAKDIKDNIVPKLEKIPESQLGKNYRESKSETSPAAPAARESFSKFIAPAAPPTGAANIPNETAEEETPIRSTPVTKPQPAPRTTLNKKPLATDNQRPIKKELPKAPIKPTTKPKGNDVYREPLQ